MEETLLNLFDSAPFLVSLLAGVLTFVSPCVLPLIPAYLSYISGISVKELQNDQVLVITSYSIHYTKLYEVLQRPLP